MTIGQRIRQCREEQGMSQSELARKMGIQNYTVLGNWESGYSRPDLEKLARLCTVLGVSSDYIIGLADEDEESQKAMKSLMVSFQELDERGQSVIRQLIEIEKAQCKARDEMGEKIVNDCDSSESCKSDDVIRETYIRGGHPEYQEMLDMVKELKELKKSSGKSDEGLLYFLWSCRPAVHVCLRDILLIWWGIRVPSRAMYRSMKAYYMGAYEVSLK